MAVPAPGLPKAVKPSPFWHVHDYTSNDTKWRKVEFGFTTSHVVVENRSAHAVEYTFAGPQQHVERLQPGDAHTLNHKAATIMWYRLTVAKEEIHIRAW